MGGQNQILMLQPSSQNETSDGDDLGNNNNSNNNNNNNGNDNNGKQGTVRSFANDTSPTDTYGFESVQVSIPDFSK